MGLPFGKKGNDASDEEKNKRFKLKVSVKNMFTKTSAKESAGTPDTDEETAEGTAPAEDAAEAKKAKKRAEREKREKKKQEKKQRKELAKKQKKVKSGKEEKKDKVRLILIAACITFLIIAIVLAVILFMITGEKTVEEQLQQAEEYIAEEKYSKAEGIYNDLLEEDSGLADAYLGLAESAVAQENQAGAISILEEGYAATADTRIAQRLQELDPARAEELNVSAAAVPEEPIVWADAAFERMLRQAMDLDASAPILPSDLQEITTLKIVGGTHAAVNDTVNAMNTLEGYTIDGQLYTERGDIRSLDDLQHFPNLRKLTIGYNQVSDIQGIAGLTQLETLGLYCNSITDISALSSLTNVRYLYLYNNSIQELSGLSTMANLQSLFIQNNSIQSIAPLAGLAQLKELYLNHNAIEDISPVRSLGQLHFLYAENNQIEDLSALAGMDSLTDVSFVGNPVGDYSPVDHVGNVNRQYTFTSNV